jgi:protein TonB
MEKTSENLDELVFENRNKAYGAYVIRKEYAKSLRTGMFVTFASVGLLVLCSFGIRSKEVVDEFEGVPVIDTGIVMVLPRPPIEHPPVIEKPAGGPKNTASIPVVANEPMETEPPVAEPQEQTSTEPGPGPAPTEPALGSPEGPAVPVAPIPGEVPVLVPDEMPEMVGDLMKFLRRNLTYPDIAVEKRTKGTVHISFVVEKDGSVSNINVLKGIGDGCEEEAVRVVRKMKWKPGKNNGHPVRVQFNLPVKFTINE